MMFNMINESDDISHLPQLKWGIAHEKDGVKSFMSDIASQHEGGLVGFQRCGLYVKAVCQGWLSRWPFYVQMLWSSVRIPLDVKTSSREKSTSKWTFWKTTMVPHD